MIQFIIAAIKNIPSTNSYNLKAPMDEMVEFVETFGTRLAGTPNPDPG